MRPYRTPSMFNNLPLMGQSYHEANEFMEPPSQILTSNGMMFDECLYNSPGFSSSDGFDSCNGLGQACDQQQCDPSSVVPCNTVDVNPCFDSTCSPRCAVDGADMSCYATHPELFSTTQHDTPSYAEPVMETTPHEYSISNPLGQITPGWVYDSNTNLVHRQKMTTEICYHPEHGIGCISPRLLTVSSSNQSFTFKQCRWILQENGNMCGMNCSSVAELQAHVEQAHLPQRRKNGSTVRSAIVCSWQNCEHAQKRKVFRQNQHLKDHIRTHTQHKPYECDWQDAHGEKCGKGFGEKKALESHRRTHSKEKPFQCPHCEKRFAHHSTLSAHMIKHTGTAQKKYKCIECDHQDNDRANLARHWDTHYPPRYMCKLCSKTFSKKANAIRHLNNRSCKCMPVNMTEAELKDSIFCQPREKGDIDFSLFEQRVETH